LYKSTNIIEPDAGDRQHDTSTLSDKYVHTDTQCTQYLHRQTAKQTHPYTHLHISN